MKVSHDIFILAFAASTATSNTKLSVMTVLAWIICMFVASIIKDFEKFKGG